MERDPFSAKNQTL